MSSEVQISKVNAPGISAPTNLWLSAMSSKVCSPKSCHVSSPEIVAIASIPILNVATNPTFRTGVVYVPEKYVPGEGLVEGEILGEGLTEGDELGLFDGLGLAEAEWLGE